MKSKYLFFLFLIVSSVVFSQKKDNPKEDSPFTYLEIKEEFDLLVDYAMVNPDCATKDQYYYSLIIGTAVIGEYIERISVLIPCLGNEFIKGDLITIKPIKTPKKNIVYAIRTYQKGSEEVTEVFGAEFKAIWGEVVNIL